MATDALSGPDGVQQRPEVGFFAGRRGRALRDNLTAYLFLAPAALIIFTFGIFPVFYAAYVSMFKWRIKQGEFRGLGNFVSAMGDVAYMFFFLAAIALAYVAVTTAIKAYRTARDNDIPYHFPIVNLLPGALLSLGLVLILLRCITFFTQQDAIDAGFAQVLGSIPGGLAAVAAGAAVSFFINRWQHRTAASSEHAILPSFAGPALTFLLTASIAFYLGYFTYTELTGSERVGLAIIRVYIMAGGIGILGVAFGIWRWAMGQHSNIKTILGILAAAGFIGAGVYFSIFWPIISKDADPDFYRSLLVTVYFSAGTVPIQLAIAVILAYLLFQDIRFKGLFRVVFFIPYMAPSVAAAGIFQVLFSARDSSIVNRVLRSMTGLFGDPQPLRWLQESDFALSQLGQAFGLDAAVNWTVGPSLALVVVILYSIWVYVGYNTVIFLAGLGNIPGELYDAAEIDGAGRWALFRHITLPLLSPITFFLSVLAVIGTFKAFNSIWVLRSNQALGTVDTASIFFFEEFFRGARFGYATSMAIVLFAIILLLTLLQNRLAEGRVHYG